MTMIDCSSWLVCTMRLIQPRRPFLKDNIRLALRFSCKYDSLATRRAPSGAAWPRLRRLVCVQNKTVVTDAFKVRT